MRKTLDREKKLDLHILKAKETLARRQQLAPVFTTMDLPLDWFKAQFAFLMKNDRKELIDLLNSERPIPANIGKLLAHLLAGDLAGLYGLQVIQDYPTKSPYNARKIATRNRFRKFARRVGELVYKDGVTLENAISEVAKSENTTRKAVQSAWQEFELEVKSQITRKKTALTSR